ncbi:MAG: hypothetical protein SPL15_05385 [Lachnospiraceae bacterium]|nr:hypothetical protein [Lachnospiraceae bacterium]
MLKKILKVTMLTMMIGAAGMLAARDHQTAQAQSNNATIQVFYYEHPDIKPGEVEDYSMQAATSAYFKSEAEAKDMLNGMKDYVKSLAGVEIDQTFSNVKQHLPSHRWALSLEVKIPVKTYSEKASREQVVQKISKELDSRVKALYPNASLSSTVNYDVDRENKSYLMRIILDPVDQENEASHQKVAKIEEAIRQVQQRNGIESRLIRGYIPNAFDKKLYPEISAEFTKASYGKIKNQQLYMENLCQYAQVLLKNEDIKAPSNANMLGKKDAALGWQQLQNNTWIYLNTDISRVKSAWRGDYYLNDKGEMVTKKWIYDQKYKAYFYLKEDGRYARNQWQGEYYLKKHGQMAEQEWIFDQKYQSYYYLNKGGRYARNQWQGEYYLKQDGKMAKSEWIYDNTLKAWYYLNADGKYARNTTTPDGYWVGADGKWIKG